MGSSPSAGMWNARARSEAEGFAPQAPSSSAWRRIWLSSVCAQLRSATPSFVARARSAGAKSGTWSKTIRPSSDIATAPFGSTFQPFAGCSSAKGTPSRRRNSDGPTSAIPGSPRTKSGSAARQWRRSTVEVVALRSSFQTTCSIVPRDGARPASAAIASHPSSSARPSFPTARSTSRRRAVAFVPPRSRTPPRRRSPGFHGAASRPSVSARRSASAPWTKTGASAVDLSARNSRKVARATAVAAGQSFVVPVPTRPSKSSVQNVAEPLPDVRRSSAEYEWSKSPRTSGRNPARCGIRRTSEASACVCFQRQPRPFIGPSRWMWPQSGP